MPPERTSEILKLFTDGIKEPWPDMDLSSLLEEYLTEAGVRQLDENAYERNQYINFPEVTVILQHSAAIYCRKVDFLYRMVTNAVTRNNEIPANSETANLPKTVEKTPRKQRRPVELSDFKPINIVESRDINMKENAVNKPLAFLPKTFMQFEARTISDDDVQLTDYSNEPFGLMRDFRVNWNVDENYALCDNVDFCRLERAPVSIINDTIHTSMVSPSDSGHNSDSYADFALDIISSPRPEDEPDLTVCMPLATAVIDNKVVKKRKVLLESPLAKMQTKYDMKSSLTGTLKEEFLIPLTEFSLSNSILQRLIQIRKCERRRLKRFIAEVDSCTDINKNFSVNQLSFKLKKAAPMIWSRRDILKKIRLSDWQSDSEIYGFSDDDDTTSKSLELLEQSCTRIELGNVDDEVDSHSVYTNVDDVPDNCYLGNSQDNVLEANIALRRKREEEANTASPSSDIAKRVEAWHLSLQEKLSRTESRDKFDLQLYSKEIFDSFDGNKNSLINFGRVVATKPQEEISRYFLTSLFLANKSKILIEQPKEMKCGDFDIHLSSTNFDEDFTNISF